MELSARAPVYQLYLLEPWYSTGVPGVADYWESLERLEGREIRERERGRKERRKEMGRERGSEGKGRELNPFLLLYQ